jgi:hypothetical protein
LLPDFVFFRRLDEVATIGQVLALPGTVVDVWRFWTRISGGKDGRHQDARGGECRGRRGVRNVLGMPRQAERRQKRGRETSDKNHA